MKEVETKENRERNSIELKYHVKELIFNVQTIHLLSKGINYKFNV